MNYGPRSFPLHTIYKLFTALCLLSANYYFLPFDTFNPLFSAKPVRLTTSSQVGGKVLWLCCAGLHVAAGTGSAPCQRSASYTFGVFPCSYWIDNLGFITEGNLLLCSSYIPLGVPQRARYILGHHGGIEEICRSPRSSQGRCAGDQDRGKN